MSRSVSFRRVGLAAASLAVVASPAVAQSALAKQAAVPTGKPQLIPLGKFEPPTQYGVGGCAIAAVADVNSPSGLNVDGALGVLPAGELPSLGNQDFLLSLGENTGACGLQAGALTTLLVGTGSTSGVLFDGFGCAAGTQGELLVDSTGLILTPAAPWAGAGFPTNTPFPIPSNPALCGAQVFVQGAFIDAVASTGVVLTNRLDLTLGLDPNAGPDECVNAISISEGLTDGSNAGATASAVGPDCSDFGPIGADVWYRFTPATSGTAVASFCAAGAGATFDTAIAAYSGDCGSLTELACNDDTCDLLSEVQFSVNAGETYFIAVGGFDGDQGDFTLSLQVIGAATNDECTQAIDVTEGLTSASNLGSSTSAVGPQCSNFGPIGSDVWFRYVPATDGFLTTGFCSGGGSASFDTAIAVYDGSCEALNELACNDDTCGLLSSVASIPVVGGATYYIAVGGFEGAQGVFDLSVELSTTATPDDCVNAEPISEGFTIDSTIGFSTSPEGAACPMGNDRWYAYTASCTGNVTVSVCADGARFDFDTVLAAYGGTCGALSLLACNDDTCDLGSEVTFAATAGETYLIQIGGFASIFGNSEGNYKLGVTCQ